MLRAHEVRTVLTLALILVVAGCAGADDANGRLSVVASFYPLAFAAERIGGGCVDVADLTPPGVEPHDLELTPDTVASIAGADLVLYLGGGFQPAVEDALGEAEGETLDLLSTVPTIPGVAQSAGAPSTDD